MKKTNVLVLCTGNSARSQMAEAFLRLHGGDIFNVYSAGTEPKGINPLTVRAMNDIGIDMSGHTSKNLSDYLGKLPVHYLIVVCHDADMKCPVVWPGVLQRTFLPFEDPAAAKGSEEERLEKFREVRDQIDEQMREYCRQMRETRTFSPAVAEGSR